MIRIKEQTKEEKIVMYMKSTKKELIEMLIECNRILDLHLPLQINENDDSDHKHLLEWLSCESDFNIKKEDIQEILEDWKFYNSNSC